MKYNHFFFSPHLDDAVLSCGGLIAKLSKKHSTLVINVFSSIGQGFVSEFGKTYINSCGYKSAVALFKARKKEEKRVAKILGYAVLLLDFPDAVFRYQKNFFLKKFFYNKEKELFGKIDKRDYFVCNEIKERLSRIFESNCKKQTKVYFPLNIGNHVDHQIVRKIGLFFIERNLINQKNIFFYEDFPYVLTIKNKSKLEFKLKKNNLKLNKVFLTKKFLDLKYKAILSYTSQINALFGSKENLKKSLYEKEYENYWSLKKTLRYLI